MPAKIIANTHHFTTSAAAAGSQFSGNSHIQISDLAPESHRMKIGNMSINSNCYQVYHTAKNTDTPESIRRHSNGNQHSRHVHPESLANIFHLHPFTFRLTVHHSRLKALLPHC